MYVGACLWTITYETVYQHQVRSIHAILMHADNESDMNQDKLDDMRIGLHSPALLCGKYTIAICTSTAIGFIGLMSYSGMQNGHGIPYFSSLAIATVLLLHRLLRTDIDQPEDCRNLFLGTPLVGEVILCGLIVDVITRRVVEGISI